MDAVEVDGVRMSGCVRKVKAQQVAFAAAEGRAGHLAVIGPGREKHARRNFDFLLDRDDIPFAQGAPIRVGRLFAPIKGGHELARIELGKVHVADGTAIIAVTHTLVRFRDRRGRVIVACMARPSRFPRCLDDQGAAGGEQAHAAGNGAVLDKGAPADCFLFRLRWMAHMDAPIKN